MLQIQTVEQAFCLNIVQYVLTRQESLLYELVLKSRGRHELPPCSNRKFPHYIGCISQVLIKDFWKLLVS